MKKTLVSFALVLLVLPAMCQDILTYMYEIQDTRYKKRKPKKIGQEYTSYISGEREFSRISEEFDSSGMIVKREELNENGKIVSRAVFTNDTANRVRLTEVSERWGAAGFETRTKVYQYDSTFRINRVDVFEGNDKYIKQVIFVTNDKGHPVEASLYDKDGKLIGRQQARYDYDKNRLYFSEEPDTKLPNIPRKIDSNKPATIVDREEIFNSEGDRISTTYRDGNPGHAITEHRYTYDQFGNWTTHEMVQVDILPDGTTKRQVKFSSKYRYWY